MIPLVVTISLCQRMFLVSPLVALTVAVLALLIYDYIKSRTVVRVKILTKSTDRDIEAFVELYDKLIDGPYRIEPAEIIAWIDEDRYRRSLKSYSCLHYLLLGKLNGDAVCFLKAMYDRNNKYLFIAYYGIDTTVKQASKLAAPAIIKRFVGLLNELNDCQAIIFEAESPHSALEGNENKIRKARLRLFKQTAGRLNVKLFRLDFDYLQPHMEVPRGEPSLEERMLLFYAPIDNLVTDQLSKEQVLDILRFVYLQIYRPTFRHDPLKDFAYQSYLHSLLRSYETSLPDCIALVE